ncbi:MAG: hypothetical protein QOD40_2003 [Alphaproteobacteria bacterium]|nr:hypothetical protein [Alphaproteobacteria bacterium]
MRHPFQSPITRLHVRPDEPDAVVGPPRVRGSRRPHADTKLAQVRGLIEQTVLTYGEIAARTGVGRASICRWTRDGGWQRPVFAPRATDTVPSVRASAKLKSRKLAARLFALADRYVRELEATPGVDLDKLGEALELVKMARLAAMGRRRRRRDTVVEQGMAIRQSAPPSAVLRPIAQLCAADVDLHRAPRPAVDDFLENRDPPRQELAHDEHGPRRRTRRSMRNEQHAWMLRKE